MENNLISRQAAIEKTEMLYRDAGDDVSYMLIGYNHALADVQAIFKFLPSAQPERKRGKWYDVGSLSCRCSECGCKSPKEYLFCPNCGAEMEASE